MTQEPSANEGSEDEKAWADIVAGWGESPVGDVPEAESIAEPAASQPPAPPEPETPAWNPVPFDLADEGAFVPPTPPPVPLPSPPRLLAWIGVIGSPLVFLVFLVLGLTLPSWASTLLVAAFIGGFVFLVATMRNDPPDPYDDGARV
ncbi:hypothetical protein GCM10011584_11390 [Nocardioides phosphati]|uniref:DUF308 domain-containing protein n=1 Tax=Nocardioides phosphati TaxID=1867775 RepID=A0ABQ2NA38_9ACTN|nr:hypothetical protein [Nocardioides phosphati]GGO87245.1 hypothetical protein GCM10011584_11390 [Nocardioides phosphati]